MPYSILVVDDERVIRRILHIMLVQAGWAVDEAADGLEAIQKIQDNQPDMVILDIMMPHIDGLSVLRLLRKNPKTADLPIIILSAKTDDKSVQKGLEMGATRYLTKPVGQEILINTVREVLEISDKVQDNVQDSAGK